MNPHREKIVLPSVKPSLLEEAISNVAISNEKDFAESEKRQKDYHAQEEQSRSAAQAKLNKFKRHVSAKIRKASRQGKTNIKYYGTWWNRLNEHSGYLLSSWLTSEGFHILTLSSSSSETYLVVEWKK